jgi:cold shock CspA family protein
MTTTKKVNGFVNIWFELRGFGFIHSLEDGSDFFCHVRNIKGQRVPQKGALVTFECGMTIKGPCALNVEIIAGAAAEVAV